MTAGGLKEILAKFPDDHEFCIGIRADGKAFTYVVVTAYEEGQSE